MSLIDPARHALSLCVQWVPRPERISRAMAKDAIGRSLQRMDTNRLDLVQFHWVRVRGEDAGGGNLADWRRMPACLTD